LRARLRRGGAEPAPARARRRRALLPRMGASAGGAPPRGRGALRTPAGARGTAPGRRGDRARAPRRARAPDLRGARARRAPVRGRARPLRARGGRVGGAHPAARRRCRAPRRREGRRRAHDHGRPAPPLAEAAAPPRRLRPREREARGPEPARRVPARGGVSGRRSRRRVRILLHTGKGGVGKTSLALASALQAAEHGHRVCAISTASAHSVGDALGRAIGPRPVEVAPRVVAQEVAALAELDRAWSEIQAWLAALLRGDGDEVAVEELLVFPGLEELVALRAVRDVEASGDFDVCVVDCAPTGSMLRMLRLPDVLRFFMETFFAVERRAARLVRPLASRVGAGRLVAPDAVFEAAERLYRDIESVGRMLLDGERTSARLVVNPARVVVDETRRSYAYLCLYGVATDAVLVNRVLPAEASGGWFARWAGR